MVLALRLEAAAGPSQNPLPRHKEGAVVARRVDPPDIARVGGAIGQAGHERMVFQPALRPRLKPANTIAASGPDPAVGPDVEAPDHRRREKGPFSHRYELWVPPEALRLQGAIYCKGSLTGDK